MDIVSPDHPPRISAPECRHRFVHDAQALASQTGYVATAAQLLLRRARLPVDVIGDTSGWCRPGTPTLLVGDHRDLVEFIPLLAALGTLGRVDAHFIAKRSSWGARVAQAVEPAGADTILPVEPRGGQGRGTFFDRAPVRWGPPDAVPLIRHSPHPTNSATLRRAAALLHAGHAVVVFPAPGGADAARTRWRPGLGRILGHLTPGTREATRIVLFRFDDIRAARVFRSLTLRSHGVVPPPVRDDAADRRAGHPARTAGLGRSRRPPRAARTLRTPPQPVRRIAHRLPLTKR